MNIIFANQNNKRFVVTEVLIILAVVSSVLSQIEPIENVTRPIMYAIWIVLAIAGCFRKNGKVYIDGFAQRFILAYALYFIIFFLVGIFDGVHYSANYIKALFVPLLVSIVGCMYSDIDRRFIGIIGRVYILCAFIFALWVQLTYFTSYNSWLNSRIYLFAQKNSAGQIWISAVLVSWFLIEYRYKIEKVIFHFISLYLLVITGFAQCRTALLGFAVGIIAFAFLRAKHKVRLLILLGVLFVLLWSIPLSHRFIEQALFLNKYAGADLNTFSSGRLGKIKEAFSLFLSSPIIGIGRYYADCSYFSIAAESGLVGLIIIEYVWIKKMFLCFSYKGEVSNKSYLFIIIFFYIIESLLEGYPPFGPGVSSFFFWFISSILINQAITENETVSIVDDLGENASLNNPDDNKVK